MEEQVSVEFLLLALRVERSLNEEDAGDVHLRLNGRRPDISVLLFRFTRDTSTPAGAAEVQVGHVGTNTHRQLHSVHNMRGNINNSKLTVAREASASDSFSKVKVSDSSAAYFEAITAHSIFPPSASGRRGGEAKIQLGFLRLLLADAGCRKIELDADNERSTSPTRDTPLCSHQSYSKWIENVCRFPTFNVTMKNILCSLLLDQCSKWAGTHLHMVYFKVPSLPAVSGVTFSFCW